jgi:hypothetical protein
MEEGQRDVAGVVSEVLTFLHLCEETDNYRFSVPMQAMSGVLPVAMTDKWALHEGSSEDIELPPVPDGAPGPFDISMVVRSRPEDGWPAGTLIFNRVARIERADARKAGCTLFGPVMVRVQTVAARPDGIARTCTTFAAHIAGRWINAAPALTPFADPGEQPDLIPFARSFARAVGERWTVSVGFNKGPRVRLLTDPTGVKEVFRLRDLPAGKDRRAALLHWVAEHYRRRRTNPDDLAWVRGHLRGAVEYEWAGFKCKIEVPFTP